MSLKEEAISYGRAPLMHLPSAIAFLIPRSMETTTTAKHKQRRLIDCLIKYPLEGAGI